MRARAAAVAGIHRRARCHNRKVLPQMTQATRGRRRWPLPSCHASRPFGAAPSSPCRAPSTSRPGRHAYTRRALKRMPRWLEPLQDFLHLHPPCKACCSSPGESSECPVNKQVLPAPLEATSEDEEQAETTL